jgi:hypothetical protein
MRTPCLVALAGLAAQPALAVGRLADVSITDRDSGETLAPYVHKGEYWVAGRPGARYAISIRSQTGLRLLAVTSVDGINVLSGQGAAANQRGYVFDPWVGYEIDGWRKSRSEIAAFTFTAVPDSYAALTGRPGNTGVIGVALFRERQPDPPPVVLGQIASEARNEGMAERSADSADKASASRAPAAPVTQALGTGHGAREYSQVVSVPFERAQAQPDETIRIRYDSHENLVARGVIRLPKPRYVPDPFPGNARLGYVPDP